MSLEIRLYGQLNIPKHEIIEVLLSNATEEEIAKYHEAYDKGDTFLGYKEDAQRIMAVLHKHCCLMTLLALKHYLNEWDK